VFTAASGVLAGLVGCADDTKVGATPDASLVSRDAGAPTPDAPILTLPGGGTDGGIDCGARTCASGTTLFCGDIADACGQTLHCGACPAGQQCTGGVCVGTQCVQSCTFPGGAYCGVIGNGCGGTLDCGSDCPPGWTCVNSMCVGAPPFCTPATCDTVGGGRYCGVVGDGCGGTLTCPANCPQAGWLCDNHQCKGPPTVCQKNTCVTPNGDHYCGTIGDGCGGSLECGSLCAQAGWVCEQGLCKAGPDAGCVPKSCTTSSGDQYCGVVGDGCGQSLVCPATCAKAGWTCQDGLCQAGPTSGCTPIPCTTANGDQYCGTIGDGCGHALACPSTCSKPGWTCQDNLCKAPATACTPVTCTPASGGRYCGTIGDGCGHSLSCGLDCSTAGPSWICGANSVCVGGGDCKKVSCNNDKGVQQYCGDIEDGCGGTSKCPATCSNGLACGSSSPHVCDQCANLCQKQIRCDGGTGPSLSGTVYDPAGLNPLYNVIVSIPNAPLDPVAAGAACNSCDAEVSGQPIATALTDAAGHFVLPNVPWGTDFPLVMQLGKWRRQVTISKSMVTRQCADNPVVESTPASLLRLPRNIRDGDNNGQYTSMPKIAITTGRIDALECLLSRIGIDTAEFTNPSGAGHINLYSLFPEGSGVHDDEDVNGATQYDTSAGGASFPLASSLFDSLPALQGYDMVLMNCAAAPTYFSAGGAYVTDARLATMKSYLDGGGKVFLEHYFATWLRPSATTAVAPYGDIATWEYPPPVGGSPITTADMLTNIDLSFAKGQAFAQWLVNVGASTATGSLQLTNSANPSVPVSKYTAATVRAPAQRWIFNPTSSTDASSRHVHYFDFLTPVAASNKCGRAVYTGIHVSSASAAADQDAVRIAGTVPLFPSECKARPLNGQEKALEFMFFDLSGCVSPPELTPVPPPVSSQPTPAPVAAPPSPAAPPAAPPPAAVPPSPPAAPPSPPPALPPPPVPYIP